VGRPLDKLGRLVGTSVPERFISSDPALNGGEGPGGQGVDLMPTETMHANQACEPKDAEVLGHSRPGRTEPAREIPRGARSPGEVVEQVPARRLGDRMKDLLLS
jgi:hypothetical protein